VSGKTTGRGAVSAAKPAAGDWGIYVNECGIVATGHGADRWFDFTLRVKDSRLTMLSMGPGGGEWHVMCGTREAASEGREIFIEQGVHKAHVKIARLSVCQAKSAARVARMTGAA
jgi:hypothetical protein